MKRRRIYQSLYIDYRRCLRAYRKVDYMDAKGGDRDVVMDTAVTSLLINSSEINRKEQVLSSEDLAWVDSCIVAEFEVPEVDNWDMVRDALLEALSSQSQPAEPSQNLNYVEEASDECNMEEMEEKKDETGDGETKKELKFENAFLPTYKEGVRVDGAVEEEDGLDFGYPLDENVAEPSGDKNEIFKVWELDYFTEESDFVLELTKALKPVESKLPIPMETPYEPSAVDDDIVAIGKITTDQSIDDVIAGVADISLSQSK